MPTPGFTRSAQPLMPFGFPLRTAMTTTDDETMPLFAPLLHVSGLFGCVRIVREGDRHRLADVPDLAECEDRLIVKGGSVIRMRNEFQDVFGCDHGVHAFDFQRSRGIDADDAPVRYGAEVNPPVQHPSEAQVEDVF